MAETNAAEADTLSRAQIEAESAARAAARLEAFIAREQQRREDRAAAERRWRRRAASTERNDAP